MTDRDDDRDQSDDRMDDRASYNIEEGHINAPRKSPLIKARECSWPVTEGWVRRRFGLNKNRRFGLDSFDPDGYERIEVKSCLPRHNGTLRKGRFVLLRHQHRRLVRYDGDYIFVLYDAIDPKFGDKYSFHVHAAVRVPAQIIDEELDLNWYRVETENRWYYRWQVPWTKVPGFDQDIIPDDWDNVVVRDLRDDDDRDQSDDRDDDRDDDGDDDGGSSPLCSL